MESEVASTREKQAAAKRIFVFRGELTCKQCAKHTVKREARVCKVIERKRKTSKYTF